MTVTPLRFQSKGFDVWYDDRIYSKHTRPEDAVHTAYALNLAGPPKLARRKPVKKKKSITVAKKKVKKK